MALAALLLSGLGAGATTAHAQSAQDRFDKGMSALNAGRYDEAVVEFNASYQLQPVPMALYNLALAYNGLSQPSKALEAFEAYVAAADPAKEASIIQAVKAEIERIKGSSGRFTVKVSPTSAVIRIDGHPAAVKDGELWMLPGQHTIEITADGYETYSQAIDVQAGRYTLEINLRKPTLTPAEQAAALVDEGMVLRTQGDASAALAKLSQAQQLYPTPRGEAQQGLAEESVGDLGAAEVHINEALKARKDPWVRENKRMLRKAQQRIMKQTRQMAKLEVGGPYPGAKIVVNDREVGKLPLAGYVYVNAGHVLLRAKLDGYVEYVFEADMPKRSLKRVRVQMEVAPAPPPVVAPVPLPAPVVEAAPPPPPPPPPPPVAELPPPPTAAEPPAPEPEPKTKGPSQADIEAAAQAREEGRLPDEGPSATGFEMVLNGGYLLWLDKGLAGSSGGPTVQLMLGARVPWFLSFGVQLINASADFSTKGTKAVIEAFPGAYVRAHTQHKRRPLSFDVWLGSGIQPVAMSAALLDAKPIDPTRLLAANSTTLATQVGMQKAGVSQVMTLQSLNVPLELGATFFITKGMGIDLAMALTFWLPEQLCYHDDKSRYCTDQGLSTAKTFFIGGGLSFLP